MLRSGTLELSDGFFSIQTPSEGFSPEMVTARLAFSRLSDEGRVAVKLRYGNDVFKWWRENGGQKTSSVDT